MLLVGIGRHGGLIVFQFLDRLLDLFLFASIADLAGSRAAAALAPNRTTGKAPASLPTPFSAVGVLLAFALAGVFEDGMLGGQPLLGVEELSGLLLREAEGFERGDGFVLVGIGRGIAQCLCPVAGKDRGVLFRTGLGGSNDHAVELAERVQSIRRSNWSY